LERLKRITLFIRLKQLEEADSPRNMLSELARDIAAISGLDADSNKVIFGKYL
jgi:hypothetical protein